MNIERHDKAHPIAGLARMAWRLSRGALTLLFLATLMGGVGQAAELANISAQTSATQSFESTTGPVTVAGNATEGASGNASVQAGNGSIDGQANGTLGLAAELTAISKVAAGGEDINASAEVDVKVKALLGAQGAINAHIDKNGISLGGEAKAGAYVSAEAKLGGDINFYGIKTNVTVTGDAYAGALAEGQAQLAVGFDGKIKFKVGVGAAVGVGLSGAIEFSVDASELIDRLGLKDLADLLVWLDEFQKDPKKFLVGIIDDEVKKRLQPLFDEVAELGKELGATANQVPNTLPTPTASNGPCQQPAVCDVANIFIKDAVAAYTDDSSALGTQIGCAGHELMQAVSLPSGMYAQLFLDPNTHQAVLAFRGTEMTSVKDWAANIANALQGNSLQMQDAANYALQVKDTLSNCPQYANTAVEIVGHSLGGALAQRAAYETGYPATTFNPAAIGNFPGRDDDIMNQRCIYNYVDAYDIVHTLSNPVTDALGQISSALGDFGIHIPSGTQQVGSDTVLGYGDQEILDIYARAEQKAQEDENIWIAGGAIAAVDRTYGAIEAGVAAHILTESDGKPGPLVRALNSECNAQGGNNTGGQDGDSVPPSTPPGSGGPGPGGPGQNDGPGNDSSGQNGGSGNGGSGGNNPGGGPSSSTTGPGYQRDDNFKTISK